MTKRKYLKKLAKALKGVPAREREDLVSYYDELIEEALERGKSARQVFSDLEPPEAVAENYLREAEERRREEKEQGDHVRKRPLGFIRFLCGVLAAVATVALAALIVVFPVAGAALAAAGVYILVVSFGLLFAGHAALFFAQWGTAFAVFALAILFEALTVLLAKALTGMWRFVAGRPKRKRSARRSMRAPVAGCAILLGGLLMFTAAFGTLGFDYKNLAVTDGLVTHEERIAVTDTISLQTANSAVTVKRSEDETCKLVYRDFPETPKRFAFSEGKAMLNGGSGVISVMGAAAELQWRRGLLVGAVTDGLQDAELYLPASFAGDLRLEIENGEASVSDMVYGNLVITVKNGGISLNGVTADSVNATTVNGIVVMKNVTAKTVEIQTTNGLAKLENVAAETVAAGTGNGAILLNYVACTRVHAATSTGGISLEDLRADFISLHTSTGAVSGTVAGREEDYAITASCSTGSCNLHDRQGGSKQLDVRVSTGSVKIMFTDP